VEAIYIVNAGAIAKLETRSNQNQIMELSISLGLESAPIRSGQNSVTGSLGVYTAPTDKDHLEEVAFKMCFYP
jgi:hypothetical protein